MTRTATITFHASHNYGSMLQAYALQQTLLELGYSNDIINLRTERQDLMYAGAIASPFRSPIRLFRSIIKNLFYRQFIEDNKKKYYLFENFLSDHLKLTERYKTLEEIAAANIDYDCYISGGDQIWNVSPEDFDWSYYLPFVNHGKRISFAVSMGPHPEFTEEEQDKVKSYLNRYDAIAVREQGTADMVKRIADKTALQTLDPVFLLDRTKWETLSLSKPIIKEDYILLYSPAYNESAYKVAEAISQKLNIKVVNTILYKQIHEYKFENNLAVGPIEFLNLIANAKLVISGSFHALAFSVIYNTPFYAVNGEKDNRMRNLLQTMGLEDRTINTENVARKATLALTCNFDAANSFVAKQRTEALNYLSSSIN